MNNTTIIDLVHSTAMLLAFTMLYENFWLKNEASKNLWSKIVTGFVLGGVGIALMLSPWIVNPGIFFDARSIMLSISGLFFGPIPTIIAMIITGSMRFLMGGAGTWMGISIIISSGTIGLLWRLYRPLWRQKNIYIELLALGLIVHLVMFCFTIFLPASEILSTRKTLLLPLILIYSPATMLLGLLLLRQSNNYQNNLAKAQDLIYRKQIEKELKNSLALVETTLNSIHNGILVVDHTGNIITSNAMFAQMWHIPDEIISSRSKKSLLDYMIGQMAEPQKITASVLDLYKKPEAETIDSIYFKDGRIFERISKPLYLEGEAKGRVWSFHDVTVRTHALERVEENEKKYRNIFENSQEGIFQTNVDGTYIAVNPALAKMYGYASPEELINSRKDIAEESYYNPEERNHFLQMMEEQGFVKSYEYEVKHKDGHKIWFYEDAHAVKDEQGKIKFFEGFVIDVTERKQADAEIIEKTEQLQKINSEKDKFFSIIAHDLRSPFNSFLGLTQIMAEELSSLTTTEIQKIALNMRNSAVNLFRLLENLLQWSRIEQGSLPFDPVLINLKTELVDSIELVLDAAINKEIEVTYDIPKDLMVYADSNMFRTVIRNIVSNAIKFTPFSGKINLKAKVDDDKNIEISIKDTGIGMTPDIVDHLFKLDVNTNRKGTHGEPSSGLGLLLCKEFITKHGGNIRIKSAEGKGTTFYLTFPNQTVSEAEYSL